MHKSQVYLYLGDIAKAKQVNKMLFFIGINVKILVSPVKIYTLFTILRGSAAKGKMKRVFVPMTPACLLLASFRSPEKVGEREQQQLDTEKTKPIH